VKDARRLWQDYADQRAELGEGTLILGSESPKRSKPVFPPVLPATDVEPTGSREAAAVQKPVSGEPKWMKGAPMIPAAGVSIPRPPKDLFTADPLATLDLSQIAERIASCRACGLCEGRQKTVPGQGASTARLVVVGEGPGANEDQQGLAFVGRAGELLTEILSAIELSRDQVFICNIVKCRPPGNRKPQPLEIAACVPYLYRQLELVGPAVILAMGGTAAETLLNTKQPLSQLRERVHDFRGTPLVVTYHPAALLRNPHWKKPTWDDVRIARRLLDAR
jgi:DNA polymerase